MSGPPSPVLVIVTGPPASGKLTIAREISAESDGNVIHVDTSHVDEIDVTRIVEQFNAVLSHSDVTTRSDGR